MSIFAERIEVETTTDGNIPAGFLFASVKNRGSQPVIVGGIPLDPGEAKAYPFVGKAYQHPIDYVLSGQALRIMYIN